MRAIAIVVILCGALLFTGCGGTDRRHSINSARSSTVPRYIELRLETSAGTLHFPHGLYVLDSSDPHGYYYRAPRPIYQRSFSGGLPHEGGIFVSKRNQRKLRGYVIMPSGLTHVGNLSSANYQFRY